MYVDYKITTWRRAHFEDNADSERIIEIIKEEGINEILDEDLGFIEQETLFEVDEEMTVEENGGYSTIEVYENNNPCWWFNLEQWKRLNMKKLATLAADGTRTKCSSFCYKKKIKKISLFWRV